MISNISTNRDANLLIQPQLINTDATKPKITKQKANSKDDLLYMIQGPHPIMIE